MKKTETDAIYISDILHALYISRILIAVMTAIGLFAGVALSIVSYTISEMKKNYTVTSAIAVTSVTEDGLFTTRSDTPNSTDIYLAENMVDSVIYVIKSDSTLTAALGELQMPGVTVNDIRNRLSLSQYKETQIIEIKLEWSVAEEGIQILEAINKVAPQILIDSLKIGGVSVVYAPKSGYRTASTVNIKLWLLFAGIGLVLGIGVTILKMLFSPVVFDTRCVQDYLGVEVLGQIPRSKSYFSNKVPLRVTQRSASEMAVKEAFSTLACILQQRFEHQKSVCLYVTSSLPNEGKTSVLANLAAQLAAIECRVLMVDLNVNSPSLGTQFLEKTEYYCSLNAVYRKEISPDNGVVHIQACLDLLPLYLEKKPLMLNDEILNIVNQYSAQYDFVLMDTAPVGLSANALNLNKIAQAAIFVIRQDETPVSKAEEALTRLNQSGIQVTGAVLNAVRKSRIM